jgi:hypothetical protein
MYPLMPYKMALSIECLITICTQIWTLNPIHITGMSAFSTVYVELFIESILVKTQRLNIRIYCDRKNKYFYRNVHIKSISTAFDKLYQ